MQLRSARFTQSGLEAKYGKPRTLMLRQEISAEEMLRLRSSMRDGRNQDVTLFIFTPDGRVAAVRKRTFPRGAYRAPSGGLKPGEDLEAAAVREAWEETGLKVKLQHYLLRIHVEFTSTLGSEHWTTHVFSAATEDRTVSPKDRDEIEDARLVTVEELQGPIREKLLAANRGFYAYRV